MTRPIEKLSPKDLGELAGKIIQDFRTNVSDSNFQLFNFAFILLKTALVSAETEQMLRFDAPFAMARYPMLKNHCDTEIKGIINIIKEMNKALIAEQSLDDVAGKAGIKLVIEKSILEKYQQRLIEKGYIAPPEKQSGK